MRRKEIVRSILSLKGETVIVRGPMGWGKTSLRKDLEEVTGYESVTLNVSRLMEGDLSIPKFEQDGEKTVVRDIPHERTGLHKKKPIILVLDEIFKASSAIQIQIAELLLERRLSSYKLNDKSFLIGTSNKEEEGFTDRTFGFVVDRAIVLDMDKPSCEEWLQEFAIPNALHPVIIEGCKAFPQFFEEYDGTDNNPYIFSPKRQDEKCVTGRSLEAASRVLYKTTGMSVSVVTDILSGVIGKAAATAIQHTLELYNKLPSFESVKQGEEKVSAEMSILFALKSIELIHDKESGEMVLDVISKECGDEAVTCFILSVLNRKSKVPLLSSSEKFVEAMQNTSFLL